MRSPDDELYDEKMAFYKENAEFLARMKAKARFKRRDEMSKTKSKKKERPNKRFRQD